MKNVIKDNEIELLLIKTASFIKEVVKDKTPLEIMSTTLYCCFLFLSFSYKVIDEVIDEKNIDKKSIKNEVLTDLKKLLEEFENRKNSND